MVLIDDDPYFLMTWSNGNETYQRLEGDDLDYFLDNQVLQCVQKRIDPEEREHSLEEQKRKDPPQRKTKMWRMRPGENSTPLCPELH